jgi:hypothetical protein
MATTGQVVSTDYYFSMYGIDRDDSSRHPVQHIPLEAVRSGRNEGTANNRPRALPRYWRLRPASPGNGYGGSGLERHRQ